jgi:DNA-directed RNA polymerase specialized sigma24 family protein
VTSGQTERRMQDGGDIDEQFTRFIHSTEPRLRRALIATYGRERGREATAEALAWAWEHWTRVESAENPVAFLYRVGQSRSRRRKLRVVFERPMSQDVLVEPGLSRALAALSDRQRAVVLLVHGAGWTHGEVAQVLGVKLSTVQKHTERALSSLRQALDASPLKGEADERR